MEKEYEVVDWCIGSGATPTDFVLCEWDWDLLPKLYEQDDVRYEYNQSNQDWSKVSCTIFSAMWAISDLMNYQFTLDELKEVDELSYTKGRIRWEWWWVKDAVNLAAKWWNEHHWDLGKVAYYRISKYSTLAEEALKKWYTLVTNFCPTSEYRADYRKDAVLNWNEFGNNCNWHAIDIIRNDWHRSTKDSYKGRKTTDWTKDCNRYELVHSLPELTNYSQYLYIYTKVSENNYERVKELNEFKTLLVQTIDNNSTMWHLTNDTDYKNMLHKANNLNRRKLSDIDNQLKLLS